MSDQDHDPNYAPEPGPPEPIPEPSKWTGTRRLSRKRMTRSQKSELDDHAKVERERKAARRRSGTPSREDVARAVLHVALHVAAARPNYNLLERA